MLHTDNIFLKQKNAVEKTQTILYMNGTSNINEVMSVSICSIYTFLNTSNNINYYIPTAVFVKKVLNGRLCFRSKNVISVTCYALRIVISLSITMCCVTCWHIESIFPPPTSDDVCA